MITTNKTTTTEKRILKRLERILPLMLISITFNEIWKMRFITFYRRHDTVWHIPGVDSDSFSIQVIDLSWKDIKEYRQRVHIKPPEKEYFYTKRCKVCNCIYFVNKISKDQYENLLDNPNIKVRKTLIEDYAEISSVCELHAEEYFKSQA